jgi:preprotein translocase subunit SecA
MFGFLKKVFGTKSEKDVRDVEPIVGEINEIYATLANISHDELRAKSQNLKAKIQDYIKEERVKIDGINAEIDGKPDMDVDTKEELYTRRLTPLEKEITKKIEEVLNEILPEAFAILKDTSRRFSENEELVVTANDFDTEIIKNLKKY